MSSDSPKAVRVASLDDLTEDIPHAVRVFGVDLVLVRQSDEVRALYGRCAHRGALMSDGRVEGDLLVCGLHGWRYEIETGVAPVNPAVTLATFPVWVSNGAVYVDHAAVDAYARANPPTYDDDGYQGQWIKPADSARWAESLVELVLLEV